ncbi:hypothetical protein ACJ8OA_06220 [Serratia sp. CY68630]|uniref:hypothetical protein n=1 Tax=Serratia sp. CY68630 TaxID=3383666 RepID=UPI003FA16038
MNVYEMEGFLRGKCFPGDLLVGESNAEYLVRKLNEASTLKAERDALAVENAALKLSRETLAKNALETCNDVFSAGYHSPALHRGLMESTGNRNTYPNPISALVNEAVRELDTPATDAALAAIRDAVLDRVIAKLGAMGSPDFTLMAVQALKNELREAK